jgi:protein required for attachment to host cells
MKRQWILVANASVARIFRRDSPLVPLVLVETMRRGESHVRGRRPATCPNARRKGDLRFAREIADRLTQGLEAHEFDSLALFAADPFMSQLNAQLGEAVANTVKLALQSDFTSLGRVEIEQRLRSPPANGR